MRASEEAESRSLKKGSCDLGAGKEDGAQRGGNVIWVKDLPPSENDL